MQRNYWFVLVEANLLRAIVILVGVLLAGSALAQGLGLGFGLGERRHGQGHGGGEPPPIIETVIISDPGNVVVGAETVIVN